MKKMILSITVAALILLTACGTDTAESNSVSSNISLESSQETTASESGVESSDHTADSSLKVNSDSGSHQTASVSESIPSPLSASGTKSDSGSAPSHANSEVKDSQTVTDSQSETDVQQESHDVPEPEPEPESKPEPEPEPQPEPAPPYGGLPLEIASGSDQWWAIDSSDSAYYAVIEHLNSIRAEAGVPALTMSGDLSAIAGSRCESFVAGGPFDHSGMVTRSEICAQGALGSAQDVCAAWKASPDHYANIIEPSFTEAGVGCWFCVTPEGFFTYWTVTFN